MTEAPTNATGWRGLWARYVALWNEREPATALALLRIAVGCVLAYDLIYVVCLDLPLAIFGDAADFNLGRRGDLPIQPLARQVFGPGPMAVWVVVYGGIVSALLFACGFLTRVSGVLTLVTQVQLVSFYMDGNRGIDQMLRFVLVLLLFSRSHETLSVDARLRHGRWARPSALVPAWPRYMVILQLVWMYSSAAISKDHYLWSASGDYMSLYYILRYQHFVRWDMTWLPAWPTQLGTFITYWFEALAALMLVACWRTRLDPARAKRATRAWWVFKRGWLTVGVGLHATLLLVMNIGIFTTGMLALYFCWLNPTFLARLPEGRLFAVLRFAPELPAPTPTQDPAGS
jgi:hypothetical protein